MSSEQNSEAALNLGKFNN